MDADEHVVREGLLFLCGEYKDKQFSLSPDEARAAVEAFSDPVPVGLEHVPNVLDGKLGRVQSIRLGDDGASIYGKVALPSWLDRMLAPNERKVSVEFDRATKRLRKLDIVRTPRVTDAALFAAFSHAHPDEVLTPIESPEPPSSSGSTAPILTPAGAKPLENAGMSFLDKMRKAYFKGNEGAGVTLPDLTPEQDKALIAAFGDKLEGDPAPATGTTPPPATAPSSPAPDPVRAPAFADTPEAKAMQAEIDRLKREAEERRTRELAAAASEFSAGLVRSGRLPASFAADAEALFKQAAADDRDTAATVTFSGGDSAAPAPVVGSRLDALKAIFSRVPTPSERFALGTGGVAVFASESVQRSDNGYDPIKAAEDTNRRVFGPPPSSR